MKHPPPGRYGSITPHLTAEAGLPSINEFVYDFLTRKSSGGHQAKRRKDGRIWALKITESHITGNPEQVPLML
jgi:hypothetical protein